ncbi:MAG: hypothetical protein A2Z75_08830 [Chloroflexi bacterium RBG_13_50_10]|nr:MAG: hypothetical protein A2Z75_08830 [Chloroflexi bacterium RBG_13_50_10]
MRAVRYCVSLIGGLDSESIPATDKILRKSELFEGEKAPEIYRTTVYQPVAGGKSRIEMANL